MHRRRMDPSNGSKINNQDSLYSSPQFLQEPPYQMHQPYAQDSFLRDRRIAEAKVPIQDPYIITNTRPHFSEETLFHQENPAAIDYGRGQIVQQANHQLYPSHGRWIQGNNQAVQHHGSYNSRISANIPQELLLSTPSSVSQNIITRTSHFCNSMPYCFGNILRSNMNHPLPTHNNININNISTNIKEEHGEIDASSDQEVTSKLLTFSENPTSSPCHATVSAVDDERKSRSSVGTSDKFKRCHCKKSRCLQLYCVCFAAGGYCGELCTCQGCSNNEEYRDIIDKYLGDPTAVLPKIIQNKPDTPSDNVKNDNMKTESLAMYVNGCNCRKSKCMKRYCECYKGNAGCHNRCTCQGCNNPHGKNETGLGATRIQVMEPMDKEKMQ